MSVQMLSGEEAAALVRKVTDEEIAFYLEHGWVKLSGLVAPELIAKLRRSAEERWARDAQRSVYRLAMPPAADAEPFWASLVFNEVTCQNAKRLMKGRINDRDIPVRYHGDLLVIYPPTARPFMNFHQDSSEHGTDRVGEVRFWVALHDIGPELGPMKFIDRTHRDGLLGSVFNELYALNKENPRDLLDMYPKLAERVTPPMEYKVGDATVHDGYTAHGTTSNTSDQLRLAYFFSYAPADIRWWNGQIANSGSERKMLKDESYPVVYP